MNSNSSSPLALPLANKHIMVTRPAHQASELIRLLEQAGAQVYCQPLIEIKALDKPAAAIELVKKLNHTDIAIFISQNAVTHAINLIRQYAELPNQVKLATVGLGSATLLENLAKRPVEITPQASYNSEGLLAHPSLQHVANKNITIFRGIGGRNLLAETLRERGAQVSYAEVYQRLCPDIDLQRLEQSWQEQPIEAICITSGEGLENLVTNISKKTAPKQLRTAILNSKLVIVNPRLNLRLAQHGFTQAPIMTDNVSDNAIVDAIIKNLT